jgi:hypothetical protein
MRKMAKTLAGDALKGGVRLASFGVIVVSSLTNR